MENYFCLNKLIASIPSCVYDEWAPFFELVDLKFGQVLYEPNQKLSYLYFPTTAIVSCIYILENGASTEVAITGREGVVGIFLLLGASQTQNTAIVQKAGSAVRLRFNVASKSFFEGNLLQKIFLRYTQAWIGQMSQGAVCHRHHTLEQQLCRLLLLTLDRQDGNTIILTHELIAQLLGVRREGVTQAAHRLMLENVLSYKRGRIIVSDRTALENRTCECYDVINNEYKAFAAALTSLV